MDLNGDEYLIELMFGDLQTDFSGWFWMDRKVKIYLKNGWYYEGVLIETHETYLIIDDRKLGLFMIRVEDIGSLKEVQDE